MDYLRQRAAVEVLKELLTAKALRIEEFKSKYDTLTNGDINNEEAYKIFYNTAVEEVCKLKDIKIDPLLMVFDHKTSKTIRSGLLEEITVHPTCLSISYQLLHFKERFNEDMKRLSSQFVMMILSGSNLIDLKRKLVEINEVLKQFENVEKMKSLIGDVRSII